MSLTAENQTILVSREDFSDVAVVNHAAGSLAPDSVRVEIGPWALTANNVTYMVTGDLIGYWKFFDPQAYGITMDGVDKMGRMPVWGYAKVTESNCEDVAVGTEIYGFFPVAKTLDMKPIKLTRLGFNTGGIDGNIGPNTRKAIRGWQASRGLPADGYMEQNLYKRLMAQ